MSLEICKFHLNSVRSLIDLMGMGHLNSNDPGDTSERIINSDEAEIPRVDPFRCAQALILKFGIKHFPDKIFLTSPDNEKGHYCPCCEARNVFDVEVKDGREASDSCSWDVSLIQQACERVRLDAVKQGKLNDS